MKMSIEKIGILLWVFIFLYSVQAQQSSEAEKHLTFCVTDENGKYINDLKSGDFQISIDGKRREIASFIESDAPATIVFIVDGTYSYEEDADLLKKETKKFAENPNNEYFVIAFDEKPQLILDKTQDLTKLEETLSKAFDSKTKNSTAFYDSIYAGIEKANSGTHQKKIIIAFSDGEDNQSRLYKMDDVKEFLKKSDVLFYAIDYDATSGTIPLTLSQFTMKEFSKISGGLSIFPNTPKRLSEAIEQIAAELKSQYRISFKVADAVKINKRQQIKIEVKRLTAGRTDKKTKLVARSRSAFYSTSAK